MHTGLIYLYRELLKCNTITIEPVCQHLVCSEIIKAVLLLFCYPQDAPYGSSEFSYKKELLNLLISFTGQYYWIKITVL